MRCHIETCSAGLLVRRHPMMPMASMAASCAGVRLSIRTMAPGRHGSGDFAGAFASAPVQLDAHYATADESHAMMEHPITLDKLIAQLPQTI